MKPGPIGLPASESTRPTLVGDHWMAVTGHPLTVQVAGRVLEAGGNAIDAGVAAGLATNVVQVDMCNLAGIAPILVHPAGSSQVLSVAGVGRWSSTATVETYTSRYGSEMPPGCHPCIVPGALAGWLSALDRFGTWSFADVASYAIELATDGFVLDSTVASALDLFAWVYEQWPSSAAIYCPGGRRARVGDRLVQADLGRLLRRLADAEGRSPTPQNGFSAAGLRSARLDAVRREFYEGEIARTVVDFVSAEGGFLTTDDLAGFQAEVAPAPARQFPGFGGLTVNVTPAEWSQGPALLQALAILERSDLASLGHNSVRYIHLVVEAIKVAFSERERYYGSASKVDVDALLSDEHVKELAELISPDAALADLPTLRHAADDIVSTTHIVVVDAEGNAFASSPSDPLAMSPIVPGLGVMVSARGVQSRTDPGHPAALGPLRRPRVTPAPAIVLGPDDMVWPIACPGGDVILQAMLQTFLNVSVFGMTEQQAVEAPRATSLAFPDSFYPHAHPTGKLVVESRVHRDVTEGLAALGHDVHEWPPFEFEAGSVGMIRRHRSSPQGQVSLRAGADPRRAAYALGR